MFPSGGPSDLLLKLSEGSMVYTMWRQGIGEHTRKTKWDSISGSKRCAVKISYAQVIGMPMSEPFKIMSSNPIETATGVLSGVPTPSGLPSAQFENTSKFTN